MVSLPRPFALDMIARGTNGLARLLLPGWVAANDRVFHATTTTDQTFSQLATTLALYGTSVFGLCAVVDIVLVRPLTRWNLKRVTGKTPDAATVKKTGWFLLHTVFNSLIVGVSVSEAWSVFRNPIENGFSPRGWWGTHPASLFGAIAIGGFHMHHLAAYTDSTTTEDVVHHLTNAGAVVVIGALAPWGRFTALSNLAMCGVPGAINYYMLWAQTPKGPQKAINRLLNIALRYPVQLFSIYGLTMAALNGSQPRVHPVTAALMVAGAGAHTLNALYYADLVVGNYHVTQSRAAAGKKRE